MERLDNTPVISIFLPCKNAIGDSQKPVRRQAAGQNAPL
jgi:hypothetical protein